MRDRYNFDTKYDVEKFNTHRFEDRYLSTEEDERIKARREARMSKKAKKVKVDSSDSDSVVSTSEKPRKKIKIKWGRFALMLLALAIVAVIVVVQGLKLANLKIEKRNAEKQLDNLTQKKEQLQAELQELDSDEYVENAARSELHMIREGEVLYIVNPDLETEEQDGSVKSK